MFHTGMKSQREITDEKTRLWVMRYNDELRPVNDFRESLGLPRVRLIYNKESRS